MHRVYFTQLSVSLLGGLHSSQHLGTMLRMYPVLHMCQPVYIVKKTSKFLQKRNGMSFSVDDLHAHILLAYTLVLL